MRQPIRGRTHAPRPNLRVSESQKSQSNPIKFEPTATGATRSIALAGPCAPHSTEVADEKLVPDVRRSAGDAEAQLREPGDGQPFNSRFNCRPVDTGGADDVEWAAIGEARWSSLAPGFVRACPPLVPTLESASKLRLLNEKAGPVSAYGRGGPAWNF
jgi:hypothetical protein